MASTRWLITIGTLAACGALTSRLVTQLDRRAAQFVARGEELRRAEEHFRSAFENAAIGIILVGLDGCWLRRHGALARLTGYPADQLHPDELQGLMLAEDVGNDVDALEKAEDRRAVRLSDRRNATVARTEESCGSSPTVTLVLDLADRPLNLISQMQDITERKAVERELAERALHDLLTGLPNRLLFLDRVGRCAREDRTQLRPGGGVLLSTSTASS